MKTIELPKNETSSNILRVVYDDNSEKFFMELQELIKSRYTLVEVIGLHENILKERKKAFKLKGGFSARKNPFAVFFDPEDTPVKAFYSEANECTVDNIKTILDAFIPYKKLNNNESTGN